MFPDNDYVLIQRRQEDLLRQAEHERLIRAMKLESRRSGGFYRKWVNGLGTQLVIWGQKLEHFSTLGEASSSPSASPHH